MDWFLPSLTCSTCQILVSLLLINYSSRHCSSYESKGLNLMFILSLFAYLSCAMEDGALGELSMGSSSASLHLVTHQSDRQQSGGLMTQACCSNTVLPFSGSWSLFLYNLACQSTDDLSFLDNLSYKCRSSLPVTILLSRCCFRCVRSSLLSQHFGFVGHLDFESPLHQLCDGWCTTVATMHENANKHVSGLNTRRKHTAALWVRMVRKTILSYVF